MRKSTAVLALSAFLLVLHVGCVGDGDGDGGPLVPVPNHFTNIQEAVFPDADIDIDSDNNNGYGLPDRSQGPGSEEDIEYPQFWPEDSPGAKLLLVDDPEPTPRTPVVLAYQRDGGAVLDPHLLTIDAEEGSANRIAVYSQAAGGAPIAGGIPIGAEGELSGTDEGTIDDVMFSYVPADDEYQAVVYVEAVREAGDLSPQSAAIQFSVGVDLGEGPLTSWDTVLVRLDKDQDNDGVWDYWDRFDLNAQCTILSCETYEVGLPYVPFAHYGRWEIRCTVADETSDSISLKVLYKTAADSDWRAARIVTQSGALVSSRGSVGLSSCPEGEGGTENVFYWDARADVGIFDHMSSGNVQLRLIPGDHNPSAPSWQPSNVFETTVPVLNAGITVVSPNGGEDFWGGNESTLIEWTVVGVTGSAELHYSIDGGGSYPPENLIATVTLPPTGGTQTCTYSWPVPDIDERYCRVRVQAVSGQPSDDSDGNFVIVPSSVTPELHCYYRQFASSLIDYPATATTLRSPMYVFRGGDRILFRARAWPADTCWVRVTNQSSGDTVDIPLVCQGGADWQTGTESLELGGITQGNQIEVRDEVVLLFELMTNASAGPLVAVDKMVDRSDYAKCSISQGNASRLRFNLRSHCISDQPFSDTVGTGDNTNDMAKWIKGAGSINEINSEADILYIGCHGNASGNLFDNDWPTKMMILDPNAPDGIAAGDWNDDVEWVILHACSTLAPAGRAAWAYTMKGLDVKRKVHGILGADGDMYINADERFGEFAEQLSDRSATFLNGYFYAMEHWEPVFDQYEYPNEYAAAIFWEVDEYEKQRFAKPDVSDDSATMIFMAYGQEPPPEDPPYYVTAPTTLSFDGGRARVAARLPRAPAREVPTRLVVTPVNTHPRVPGLPMRVRGNGCVDYGGPRDISRSERHAGRKSDAVRQARDFISRHFADDEPSLVMEPLVARRVSVLNGKGKKQYVDGYLVRFSLTYQGTRIGLDGIHVFIKDGRIVEAGARRHEARPVAGTEAIPVPMLPALSKAAPGVRRGLRLGPRGHYKVDRAWLRYVPVSTPGPKAGNRGQEYRLVWTLRASVGKPTKRLSRITLDASTGSLIEATAW